MGDKTYSVSIRAGKNEWRMSGHILPDGRITVKAMPNPASAVSLIKLLNTLEPFVKELAGRKEETP